MTLKILPSCLRKNMTVYSRVGLEFFENKWECFLTFKNLTEEENNFLDQIDVSRFKY